MDLRAYTDGSCKPNPGAGGWAWVYHSVKNPSLVFCDSGGESKKTTNNRMEMMALIQLLQSLHSLTFRKVNIYLDTQYVLKSLLSNGEGRMNFGLSGRPMYTGYAKKWDMKKGQKGSGERLANQDLWIELHKELSWWGAHKRPQLIFHWVKGHNGDPGNELVDSLAQNAVPRKSSPL